MGRKRDFIATYDSVGRPQTNGKAERFIRMMPPISRTNALESYTWESNWEQLGVRTSPVAPKRPLAGRA